MGVYDRMLKLIRSTTSFHTMPEGVVCAAIANLKTVEEIKEFVDEYKVMNPENYRNTVAYFLGHFDLEDRKLWNEAVGDIIGINLQWNRSERELYTEFEYVDSKGNPLPKYENTNKGTHFSR